MCRSLEDSALSEISQAQKDEYCVTALNTKSLEQANNQRLPGAGKRGWWGSYCLMGADLAFRVMKNLGTR